MIELVDTETCTSCNICVRVCPTNVFDKTGGVPVIARQDDCQTCFMCELYCPEDSLYVSPFADTPVSLEAAELKRTDTFGSYRRAVGWTKETRDQRGIDRSYQLFGH
jgi:NAD-dependent dihydropyrimidine dehydrogenase PreA subunit